MSYPAYITNEVIHSNGTTAYRAVLTSTPIKYVVQYDSLDAAGQQDLAALVTANGGVLTIVKPTLDQCDVRGAVVGAWNEDGSFNTTYPFNATLYQDLLNDIVSYDAQGNVISTRRPTLAEALQTQVNRYAGMLDRTLV